jgi:NAD(P)-dependent dehydrogenase (short-subunit alcohol dehydrogenase family)
MKDVVVVTGSFSGIGEAIARKLHVSGYQVVLTGLDRRRTLHRLQSELTGSLAFVCDFRQAQEVEAFSQVVEAHLAEHGQPLKGLVNNAGIFTRQSFLETGADDWREQFEVNMLAPAFLTKRLYASLKKSAPSSVLNISSSLGLRPVTNTSAYSAAKAALINWTKALAIEWATENIRVNCICPGIVDTQIHSFHGKSDTNECRKQAHAQHPLGRMGRPEDIAEAAEFLLGPRSNWTTGSVLSVDGGIGL